MDRLGNGYVNRHGHGHYLPRSKGHRLYTNYQKGIWYPYTYGYMYDDRSECDCIPYETLEMCRVKQIRYGC